MQGLDQPLSPLLCVIACTSLAPRLFTVLVDHGHGPADRGLCSVAPYHTRQSSSSSQSNVIATSRQQLANHVLYDIFLRAKPIYSHGSGALKSAERTVLGS